MSAIEDGLWRRMKRWVSERRETRETDWLCSERAQFDCFLSVWVEAADATSATPNMDIH